MQEDDSANSNAVSVDWTRIIDGNIKHVYQFSDPVLQDGISFVILKDGKESTLTIRIPYDIMPECDVTLDEW